MADYSAKPAASLGLVLRIDGAVVAKGFVEFSASGPAEEDLRPHHRRGGRVPRRRGEHRSRRLPPRRPALGPARAVRRPARPGHQRRRPHRPARGRGLLPRDRAAGQRSHHLGGVRPCPTTSRRPPSTATTSSSWPTWPSPAPPWRRPWLRYVQRGGGLFLSVGSRVNLPDLERSAGPAAAPAAQRLAHRRRPARPGRRRDNRRPPGGPAGPPRPPPPAAVGLPLAGRGARLGPLLQVPAARAGARHRPVGGDPALRHGRARPGGEEPWARGG